LCQRPRCWYFRLENFKCLKRGGDVCYAKEGENKYNAIFGDGGPSVVVHPSDLAPMLIALGASLTIAGPAGTRDLPLEKFFLMPTNENHARRDDVLDDGEMSRAARRPVAAAPRWSWCLECDGCARRGRWRVLVWVVGL